MKPSPAFIFPLLLYFAVIAAVSMGSVADLAQQTFFLALPHVLFVIAFAMGVVCRNSRISFLCLLYGLFTWTTDRAAFVLADLSRTAAVSLVGAIYLPIMTVVFFYMPERGMKSNGRTGVILTSIGGLMLVLLPELKSFGNACLSANSALLGHVSSIIAVPFIGFLLFLCALPLLIGRREKDHPALGTELAITLLCVFTAANFQSALWASNHQRLAFISFMTCAGAVMVWALAENAWRTANIDALTELPGRRPFEHHLSRLGGEFCIAIADVDHFKNFNDTYGHDAGDEVLRYVASHMRGFEGGVAYRYGGEEFAIVFENASLSDIRDSLETLRRNIASRNFIIRSHNRPRKKPKTPNHDDSVGRTGITITVSIGAAESRAHCKRPADVFSAADRALYRAKDAGRNCIMTAEEDVNQKPPETKHSKGPST